MFLKKVVAVVGSAALAIALSACAHHDVAANQGYGQIRTETPAPAANSGTTVGTTAAPANTAGIGTSSTPAVISGPAAVDNTGRAYTSSSAGNTGNSSGVGTNTNVNLIPQRTGSDVTVTQSAATMDTTVVTSSPSPAPLSASGRRLGKRSPFRIYSADAKPCSSCSVVNVFFATNRRMTGDISRGSRVFSNEPSERLRYGLAQVSIPPDGAHRIGRMEHPSIVSLQMKWNPQRHVMLLNVDLNNHDAWLNSLQTSLSPHSSSGELLIFIHGFNVRFIDAARRTAQIAHDLAFDGVPVMFTWPSRGELTEQAYRADERSADAAIPMLKAFLIDVAKHSGAKSIHIVAHSMGNRLLVQTLAALAGDVSVQPKPHFNQIALTAPDIDADVMVRLARLLVPLAKRTTLYASSHDRALEFAERVNVAPRAGLAGDQILIISGIDSIDASAVDTDLIGHFYYAENRSVLSDIYYLIREVSDQFSHRFGLETVMRGSRKYWIFKP